jgi:RimJ/RimL family protein N-acetyltransferase
VAFGLLRFDFKPFNLDHIIALVHPENLASRHGIEKCGMAYVETMPLYDASLKKIG